jgi:membrane protein
VVIIRLFWRFVLICANLTNEFLDKNGPHLAAAITYYSLLSLFPLALAVISLLGFFLGSESLGPKLALAVKSLVPVSQDTVSDTLQMVARTKHVTGALGIVGLLWASTTVFGAIRKGVNAIWGIRKPRRFFQERLIDLSFTAGAGLLIMIPMATTALLGFLGGRASVLYPFNSDSWEALLRHLFSFLSPILTFIVFMLVYRYLPNAKVTFRDVWPGALMGSIAFEVAKALFLWYARTFPVYNLVYGPVGALIAILTWVYVSAFILLYGALVTAHYSGHLARKAEEKAAQIVASIRKLRAAVATESDDND